MPKALSLDLSGVPAAVAADVAQAHASRFDIVFTDAVGIPGTQPARRYHQHRLTEAGLKLLAVLAQARKRLDAAPQRGRPSEVNVAFACVVIE
jgi:hypothetical protein